LCFCLAADIYANPGIFLPFAIQASLYRARRKSFPALPETMTESIIPENLSHTKADQNFIMYQSDDNYILQNSYSIID